MTDWWQTKQWRLIQTNLRETDMLDISAARVVADLLEFRANVLMINAAGSSPAIRRSCRSIFRAPFSRAIACTIFSMPATRLASG